MHVNPSSPFSNTSLKKKRDEIQQNNTSQKSQRLLDSLPKSSTANISNPPFKISSSSARPPLVAKEAFAEARKALQESMSHNFTPWDSTYHEKKALEKLEELRCDMEVRRITSGIQDPIESDDETPNPLQEIAPKTTEEIQNLNVGVQFSEEGSPILSIVNNE